MYGWSLLLMVAVWLIPITIFIGFLYDGSHRFRCNFSDMIFPMFAGWALAVLVFGILPALYTADSHAKEMFIKKNREIVAVIDLDVGDSDSNLIAFQNREGLNCIALKAPNYRIMAVGCPNPKEHQ